MALEHDAMTVMNTWRDAIKGKERKLFDFYDRISLRLQAIRERMYSVRLPLPDWRIREAYYRAIGKYEFIDPEWRTIRVGETWGGTDVSAFFERRITLPDSMAGQTVMLRFYIGGDSLLKLNGKPYHGLDPFRNEVLLTTNAEANTVYDIEVESYVNWHSGEDDRHPFQLAELAAVDRDMYRAFWDFYAAFKVLGMDPIDARFQRFLEHHLWEALKQVPVSEDDPKRFKAALLAADSELQRTVYDSDNFQIDGLMQLVGHSHLDIVFMWPYREFVRKVGRTHATMLHLMEHYPEFIFSQSQAKLYDDMKRYYPDLFEQVKARVAEGRWEPIGAFWVEPDCNLIAGESFVRQILYGQKFWETEFGIRSRTCWQPDVFGLSWGMPQILQRSGLDFLVTNKQFVWNDTNPWRTNTFWWEGPDGSRVLAVIPPGHFIEMMDPDHMDKHWHDFSDKETIGESIYCYGWGDGGGGVDPEMLECARRYAAFPGMVGTQFARAEDALDSIKAKADDPAIPTWRDELYLEAHRGTYTSRARLKKLNRQAEFLYREAELAAALAWAAGASYPAEKLDEGWKTLLTTQFHDSLPGTHVAEVYPQLLQDHATARDIALDVRDNALAALIPQSQPDTTDADAICVFNSLLHPRSGLVTLPGETGGLCDANGALLTQQKVTSLDGDAQTLVRVPGVPPVGFSTLQRATPTGQTAPVVDAELRAAGNQLENAYLRATFDGEGRLISLWDKEHVRELIVEGQTGNTFQLFEDQPGKYDAWDIAASYVEHAIDISGSAELTVEEQGPLRASLRLTKTVRASTITQRISLYAGSRQLEFDTQIEWVERQKLLKVAFPVSVNAHTATCDIAFGSIERPTHRNTSYDAAKFEVPAHQWIDLSENGYGVALLNDCKYGHEIDGKLLRLTLLKGPVYPDPACDMETHRFRYCLYPHSDDWRTANVIQTALDFNWPLLARAAAGTNDHPASHSFMHCDVANVTLEAVKRAEDGADVIVRLVERHNRDTRTTLRFDRLVREAWTCDLMETRESALPVEGETVTFSLKPFEIVTLRVTFDES